MPQPPSLRVAIVAASLRILGGQAVQAQRLLDAWRADPAVTAWLVPINPVPPAPFDRLLRIKFVRTLATQAWYWPLLLRELRRADVVHVFSASYTSFLLSPLPAVLVARALGKPVLLNYHSGEAPDHLAGSGIARFVLRHLVDLNVVPSAFLQGVFATFGIPARVVSNVVDLDRFRYRERTTMTPRLVSTRNFEPLYNVACTLRAFARIQARHPDASLTLVGAGSEDAMLRALAAALELRHVTFAGRVAPDAMPRYYADADAYLQTPSIDNMPLSVLEAFASGTPVVSTDVGGVSAILTDGVHGLLAPDNDDQAVADQVERLLADPARAREMAAAARASCDAYTWAIVRGRWLEAYHDARAVRAGAGVPVEAA
ncbi:MAG TPA: glycosyltransferase family 4 protein [Vicinamibacterales bacterium]|nr:glycosyltransferase family 4 protein [Vicinamibacterales bacterium]